MPHRLSVRLGSFALLSLLPGCLDPYVTGIAGLETSSTGAGETTESEATTTTTGDETSSSSGLPTTGGSSGSSSTTSDEEVSAPSPWDGEPLPPDWDGQWRWVEFPDAFCRDGSNTGLWVRYGEGDGLVIMFEGGGACFNALTCANNLADYKPYEYGWPGYGGILLDDPLLNPVGDWNAVYIPYCTGDVHGGDRTDMMVPGLDLPQQFVGYRNVAAFLERVVPTFSDVSNVLVTGASAGGFGAGLNYDRIAHAFPHARVTLVDDSGPPLANDVLATCLQEQWSELWGFEDTLPQDCPECLPSNGGGLVHLARYLAKKHPDQRFGLVSSTQDLTIRFFFGYGEDECMPATINVPAAKYEAGLVDLRDNYIDAPAGVWGTYLVGDSDRHVWTTDNHYGATSVGGVTIVDWVGKLLAGEATNVGP